MPVVRWIGQYLYSRQPKQIIIIIWRQHIYARCERPGETQDANQHKFSTIHVSCCTATVIRCAIKVFIIAFIFNCAEAAINIVCYAGSAHILIIALRLPRFYTRAPASAMQRKKHKSGSNIPTERRSITMPIIMIIINGKQRCFGASSTERCDTCDRHRGNRPSAEWTFFTAGVIWFES